MDSRTKSKELRLRQLIENWRGCKKCKLHEIRKNIVFCYGDLNADIAVIGMGPGKNEDEEGVPFIGESGLIINDYLDAIKMLRDDLFFMNIVSCRPFNIVIDPATGKKKEENRNPSLAEREACRPLWQEMLYIVDPLLVVALGKPTIIEVTGRRSITLNDVQGVIDTCTIPGQLNNIIYPVMNMFHPAGLARSGDRYRGGPWHKTMVAWRRAAYFVDQLKHLYYGTPMPDRGHKKQQMFMIEKELL
ncbi:MAG: uracil-DNA glycosylase [Candidatus Thorarchaeota archaeon]